MAVAKVPGRWKGRWLMDDARTGLSEEARIIPAWAFVLAFVVFAGIQAVFHAWAWPREHHPPPAVLRALLPIFAGTVSAFFVLLIGYVNRDAGRRGMNRLGWTLGVIFIPNAIGFILYFLLRKPLVLDCPQCGAQVNRAYNFCPRCNHALHPACPSCKRAVGAADAFCPYCGATLTARA